MGTSYVEYKNYGFWTRDSLLSEWLQSMIAGMQASPQPEPWLQSLIEHWKIQTEINGGCMSLDLDEFLTDETRRNRILQFAQHAVLRSEETSRKTGKLFIDLLSGTLKTTASSPIDYL